MINNLLWKIVAFIVSRPFIVNWLITRAMKTPYSHIPARNSDAIYMYRYWLFNPYTKDAEGSTGDAKWSFLPSIRLHQIMLADDDEHPHDHPWDARTIILQNMYIEERRIIAIKEFPQFGMNVQKTRRTGDTATVKFNEYHRIIFVPKEGVYTLFFTWKFMGTWGFLKDGKKIPYKEYLGL